MQKEERLYLNKNGIIACKNREEDKVLYKYNATMLPYIYQTELLLRSQDQMGQQGIDKVYQRILKLFKWPGMKKGESMSVMPIGERSQDIGIPITVHIVNRVQCNGTENMPDRHWVQ